MVFGLQTQPKSWLTGYTFWVNHYLEIVFSKISYQLESSAAERVCVCVCEALLVDAGSSLKCVSSITSYVSVALLVSVSSVL